MHVNIPQGCRLHDSVSVTGPSHGFPPLSPPGNFLCLCLCRCPGPQVLEHESGQAGQGTLKAGLAIMHPDGQHIPGISHAVMVGISRIDFIRNTVLQDRLVNKGIKNGRSSGKPGGHIDQFNAVSGTPAIIGHIDHGNIDKYHPFHTSGSDCPK